mgnify:CR=1 FL=1
MKSLKEFKTRAIHLRKRGLSYNEIRRHVPVAKSTLSLWLKGVRLSEEHRKRLYTKQISILSRGPKSQKERREREITTIIQAAEDEIILPLSLDAWRLAGAAIYWSEGSKTNDFEVTNSDPYLILFLVRWLEKIFDIKPETLSARLNIYPQQNEYKIKKFWSELTGIPFKNFGKSFIKPPTKGYKKNNLYYGTIKIRVPRGTDMRHRVFGWIQAALKDLEPKVAELKRRWVSLRNTERPPVNL